MWGGCGHKWWNIVFVESSKHGRGIAVKVCRRDSSLRRGGPMWSPEIGEYSAYFKKPPKYTPYPGALDSRPRPHMLHLLLWKVYTCSLATTLRCSRSRSTPRTRHCTVLPNGILFQTDSGIVQPVPVICNPILRYVENQEVERGYLISTAYALFVSPSAVQRNVGGAESVCLSAGANRSIWFSKA